MHFNDTANDRLGYIVSSDAMIPVTITKHVCKRDRLEKVKVSDGTLLSKKQTLQALISWIETFIQEHAPNAPVKITTSGTRTLFFTKESTRFTACSSVVAMKKVESLTGQTFDAFMASQASNIYARTHPFRGKRNTLRGRTRFEDAVR